MNQTPGWARNIGRTTIAAAVLVLAAGPLIKFGILPWQAGLGLFVAGAILAGIGGIICLVALLRKKGNTITAFAAAAGLAGLLVPVAIVANGRQYPPIHDISTDTANPPAFVTITPELRGAGSNPVAYDPAIAPVQAKAYPDLQALVLPEAPPLLFPKAVAAVGKLGWTIVDKDEFSGRIEATDTVPWWGFKDDVVIRITPDGSGSRIDVRSKSRVGVGDLGVNAARVNAYLDALKG